MANELSYMAPAMQQLNQNLTGIAGLQLQQQRLSQEAEHQRNQEVTSQSYLKMNQETHTENINKLKSENMARQKEEERLNRGWDPTTEPLIQMMDSKGKQETFDRLKANGLINPETMTGDQRGRTEAIKMLESDTKLYDSVFGNISKRQRAGISELIGQKAELESKGNADPKKVALLDSQIKAAREQWEVLDGKVREGAKRVAIKQSITQLQSTPSKVEGLSQWDYLTKKYPGVVMLANSAFESGDDAGFSKELIAIDKLENTTKEPTYEMKTIYGPAGGTKEVSVQKGSVYTPPPGWSLKTPDKPEKSIKPNNVTLVNPQTKERTTIDKNSDEYGNLRDSGWDLYKEPRPLPANEIQGLKTLDNLYDISGSLKGIGTKYAGPIVGRARLLSAKVFDDPEFVKTKSELGKLMPIIYALSGKQINEWEKKWLKEDIIPNLTSPGGNFEATLDSFKTWIDSKRKDLRSGYEESGYRIPSESTSATKPTKKPLSAY
jgi:hypothetical protein